MITKKINFRMVSENIFEGLTSEESDLVVDAVPLVTILIAGADGEIDAEEKAWSKKLTDIRTYAHPDLLNDYYILVGKTFTDKMNHYINELPNTPAERNNMISEKLKGLNAIFPKMSPIMAKRFHTSLTSFAQHVAKASGGFLGFGSISKAEKEWMELPMLDVPVYYEPEADEESTDEA